MFGPQSYICLAPTGGSVYEHFTGLSSQNAPPLTTHSCKTEHLLAVNVVYMF